MHKIPNICYFRILVYNLHTRPSLLLSVSITSRYFNLPLEIVDNGCRGARQERAPINSFLDSFPSVATGGTSTCILNGAFSFSGCLSDAYKNNKH